MLPPPFFTNTHTHTHTKKNWFAWVKILWKITIFTRKECKNNDYMYIAPNIEDTPSHFTKLVQAILYFSEQIMKEKNSRQLFIIFSSVSSLNELMKTTTNFKINYYYCRKGGLERSLNSSNEMPVNWRWSDLKHSKRCSSSLSFPLLNLLNI